MALRLGLRPSSVSQLRPVDIWDMWEAWRWRWSRDLEATMTAAVYSNFAPGKIDPIVLCRRFHDYVPDPRRDDGDEDGE